MDALSVVTPVYDTKSLKVNDCILVSGLVYAGRDAVLPEVCKLIRGGTIGDLGIVLEGGAVMHTAVSIAGIGPTSSNKLEIEESFCDLCNAGVKLFLGKGLLSAKTVEILDEAGAIFATVPPVTALLKKGTVSQRIIAFPELGMEAFYEVELLNCPAIVTIAHGERR